MQDTALYQYLLGLQLPWTVSRVTLDVQGQRVDVWAEHAEAVARTCLHCAKTLLLYDHTEEQTWRHLDSCQFQTYLHARIPRVVCGEHGVRLPEHRTLQDGDLLPLRRARSLPMLNPEVPLFRSKAELWSTIKECVLG